MSIKPLNDRIVVQRQDSLGMTAGGIIVPDSAQEKPTEGIVVAVGTGHRQENGGRTPLSVTVGDTVVFSQYGGQEVTVAGEEYVILRILVY